MEAGINLITLLSDISLIIILLMPVIVVYVLLRNNKEVKYINGLVKFGWLMLFLNFILIKTFIENGNYFWVVLFWQFLILYPISLCAIYYLLKLGKGEVTPRALLSALTSKQKYVLSLILILSFASMILGTIVSNQKVLETHNQLMEELLNSENAMETLVYKSINSGSVLEILPDLQEIIEGEIKVFSLPWSSKLIVTTKNENSHYITREFTYVRFYYEWKLDGLYDKSMITNDQ